MDFIWEIIKWLVIFITGGGVGALIMFFLMKKDTDELTELLERYEETVQALREYLLQYEKENNDDQDHTC